MKADAISAGAEDGRGLWLRWVLANSLAETVGLGASFGVGAALFPYLQAPGILIALATAGAAILAGTLIEGTAVGTAQWLVLRHPFPNMKWRAWALATAAGAFAAWALGMLPSTLMSAGSGAEGFAPTEPGAAVVYGLAALMGLVAGTILGTPQWLVLRRHVRWAALWVPANALGARHGPGVRLRRFRLLGWHRSERRLALRSYPGCYRGRRGGDPWRGPRLAAAVSPEAGVDVHPSLG